MQQAAYLGHFGSDLMVVDCAKVSFDKRSNFINSRMAQVPVHQEAHHVAGPYRKYLLFMNNIAQNDVLSFNDFKLIHYLASNGHWSPFSHPVIQFRIEVPVAIGAQLKRHTVGLAINEVSRRYVDTPPRMFTPQRWRARPERGIKQGSGTDDVTLMRTKESPSTPAFEYAKFIEQARDLYDDMIAANVAPELARLVLPQSMMTAWIWTGSLYAFARICKQRTEGGHAQEESVMIAKEISDTLMHIFPAAWGALMEKGSSV